MRNNKRNELIDRYATEIADFTLNAKRGDKFIEEIQKILNRKLEEDKKLGIRIHIELSIQYCVVSTILHISFSEEDRQRFLDKYKNRIQKTYLIFGNMRYSSMNYYADILNMAFSNYLKLENKLNPWTNSGKLQRYYFRTALLILNAVKI